MNRMAALILLLLMAFAPTAFADLTFQMDELTGEYPGDKFQIITFPDDLTGVSDIVGTCTQTSYAGTRSCMTTPGNTPESFTGTILVNFHSDFEGETYGLATYFTGAFPSGYTITVTQTFNRPYQPTIHQLLAGKTVRVDAIFRKNCEVIEPPRSEVHLMEIRLVGDISPAPVPVKQTSLSTIKALFE